MHVSPDKRGPGRPPLPSHARLSERVTVRLTHAEARALRKLARRMGSTDVDALRYALRLATDLLASEAKS